MICSPKIIIRTVDKRAFNTTALQIELDSLNIEGDNVISHVGALPKLESLPSRIQEPTRKRVDKRVFNTTALQLELQSSSIKGDKVVSPGGALPKLESLPSVIQEPTRKRVKGELPPLDFGAPGMDGVNGSKAGLPSHIFRCYNAEKIKLSLVHIPKNAGSALFGNVNELLCVSAGKEPGCGMKAERGPCPTDPRYFIFTFTRNPWDRAVSMWSYGLKRLQMRTKDMEERKRLVHEYCTFEQCIDDLSKNSLKDGKCGYHMQNLQYPSIYSQNGKPGVHFAGRLEHFDRDFKTILKV